MEAVIAKLLRQIGLRGTLRGFHYCVRAVLLVMEDETRLLHLMKRLYPEIAASFHATPAQVERSLRTVISLWWEQGDVAILEGILGRKLHCKPYAGEFIDMIYGLVAMSTDGAVEI